MVVSQIIQFAKNNGYETAIEAEEWNGYQCYEPIYSTKEPAIIGPPLMILVKGNIIRFSTYSEAMQMMEDLD